MRGALLAVSKFLVRQCFSVEHDDECVSEEKTVFTVVEPEFHFVEVGR